MKFFRPLPFCSIEPTSFLIPVIVLLSVACGKSGSPGNPPNPTGPGGITQTGSPNHIELVTTIDYDQASGERNDSTLLHIGYDGQNRAISNLTQVYTLPSGMVNSLDTILISYTADKIILNDQKWYSPNNSLASTTTHWLNPLTHLADSSTVSQIAGVTQSLSQDKITYQYDANGYLLSESQYTVSNGKDNISSVMNFSINNGNTVAMHGIIYFEPGDTSGVTLVIFDTTTFTSQVDPSLSFTGNGNNFLGTELLTGHANTDLEASMTVQHNPTQVFTYTFDGQGRISAMMTRTTGGQLIQWVRYSYY